MTASTARTAPARGAFLARHRLRVPLGVAVVAGALVLGTAIPAVAVTPLAIPAAPTTTGVTGLRSNATAYRSGSPTASPPQWTLAPGT